MRFFAAIALWLCVQWTLMPLCLCEDGSCPSSLSSQGASACCHETAATNQAERGICDDNEVPCPHCEGGEQVASSKPVAAPEPKLLEMTEIDPAFRSATPGNPARALPSAFSRARTAPPWWAAQHSRLSVFLI